MSLYDPVTVMGPTEDVQTVTVYQTPYGERAQVVLLSLDEAIQIGQSAIAYLEALDAEEYEDAAEAAGDAHPSDLYNLIPVQVRKGMGAEFECGHDDHPMWSPHEMCRGDGSHCGVCCLTCDSCGDTSLDVEPADLGWTFLHVCEACHRAQCGSADCECGTADEEEDEEEDELDEAEARGA